MQDLEHLKRAIIGSNEAVVPFFLLSSRCRVFGAARKQRLHQHEREHGQPGESLRKRQAPLRDSGLWSLRAHLQIAAYDLKCFEGRNYYLLLKNSRVPVCLSFQIQTRLQNLGSSLQNKSNDIEVLAVSHLSPPPASRPSHLICWIHVWNRSGRKRFW